MGEEIKFSVGDRVELNKNSGFYHQCQGTDGMITESRGSWWHVNWDCGGYGNAYPEEDLIKLNKGGNMKTLTKALERELSPEAQAQYKAEFINGGLELTETGRNELMDVLAETFKKQLTARANEKIKEEEKKSK